MPTHAKHRRPKTSPLARRLIAVGTGGAVLIIPVVAATTAEAAPSAHRGTTESAPATNGATQNDNPAIYSVVAGDSLSKIADTHSLSGGWKTLYKENRAAVGEDPAMIHPGLMLKLGGKAESQPAIKSAADPATTSATGKTTPRASITATPTAAKAYSNDLDGWINESLDIMAAHGIPGTFDGIYRNIMRESSGNPAAINLSDSNAAAGIPSKGLLQVIDPTFQAYHVPGTSMDSYDPVANITAACNYAAAKYGSIDNVNGAY
jgi:hypothetical protein